MNYVHANTEKGELAKGAGLFSYCWIALQISPLFVALSPFFFFFFYMPHNIMSADL